MEKSVFESDKEKAIQYLDWLRDKELITSGIYDKAVSQVDTATRIKMSQDALLSSRGCVPLSDHVDVYVDGSYNAKTNEFGYGIYTDDGETKQVYFGHDACIDGGRNVEGEVAASRKAIELLATNPQYKSMTIHHDYEGIGKWANHNWKANKQYTRDYASFVDAMRDNIDINFEHVKGHSGVEGNEYVDILAKYACDVGLTRSEKCIFDDLMSNCNVLSQNLIREYPELNIQTSDDEMGMNL